MQRKLISHEESGNTTKIFQALNAEKSSGEIPQKQFVESAFMDEVVKEVKAKFVTGNMNNKMLRNRAKENPENYSQFNLDRTYMYLREPYFSYHASRIPGTNFIAAAGPRDSTKESFLANTVDNKELPIHDVVALTSCMAYNDYTYQDCYDYILKPRGETWGQYHVKINEAKGEFSLTLSGHQAFPGSIITNSLDVVTPVNQSKKLNVTLFPLEDNNYLNVNDERTREKLWSTYQTSLERPILVHCASGVGRTGHLILTLEILKNHEKVFASHDPKISAQEINKIIANMRSVRPALVNTEMQLETAIRNARLMHHYYLSNQQTVEQVSTNKQEEKLTSSPRVSR